MPKPPLTPAAPSQEFPSPLSSETQKLLQAILQMGSVDHAVNGLIALADARGFCREHGYLSEVIRPILAVHIPNIQQALVTNNSETAMFKMRDQLVLMLFLGLREGHTVSSSFEIQTNEVSGITRTRMRDILGLLRHPETVDPETKHRYGEELVELETRSGYGDQVIYPILTVWYSPLTRSLLSSEPEDLLEKLSAAIFQIGYQEGMAKNTM